MPLIETKGAASAQGFGEFSKSGPVNYIEDVFSTYLYTGNGSTQTITNGIDLSGKGGLVWIKSRSNVNNNFLVDTTRGATKNLESNSTNAEYTFAQGLTAFSGTGFSLGTNAFFNGSGTTFASWAFREQPKFFDVVTYTGNGANRTIAHNLGSVPGCIIVKRTDTNADWQVYHRSLANTEYMVLNSSTTKATDTTRWNSTTPTSTVFSVGTDATVNANGGTYVAYLFAHDAGGFGLSGTDNVISCGSFTTDGSGNATVNLGYEPQWLLVKPVPSNGYWLQFDAMRGWNVSGNNSYLAPNSSDAETAGVYGNPTATGFVISNTTTIYYNNAQYIYIAIRRGPMKVPTSGTSVFVPSTRTGTGASGSSTALGEVTDLVVTKSRGSTSVEWAWTDRLRGPTKELTSVLVQAETTFANDVTNFASMTGFNFGTGASGRINTSSVNYIDYLFKRAPGFMDIVCYSGTGTTMNVPHNLGAVPRLIITKARNSGSYSWYVMPITAFSGSNNFYMILNSTSVRLSDFGQWGTQNPTATTFRVGGGYDSNQSGVTYVAYLFSDVLGVSKIALYTGNGSSQTINCGFTAGARFVLIKSIDGNGGAIAQTGWYVWDSARGIVSGNDPYLALNDGSGEVTTDDSIDTDSTGFIVNQLTATNINVNGRGYIYLAIA